MEETKITQLADGEEIPDLTEDDIKDAQEDFLTDINRFIKEPKQINHWTIILNRRKYKAWAIAHAILEEIEK